MNRADEIKAIIGCLEGKNLKFWSLTHIKDRRNEIYTIFGQTEADRLVNLESMYINLYVDHEDSDGKYTGGLGVEISLKWPIHKIEGLIDKAINLAKLVKNKSYEIVQEHYNYNLGNVIVDENIKDNPLQVIAEIDNNINVAVAKFSDVKLSSSEYLLSYTERFLINSFGNSFKNERTNMTLDAVFLAGKNQESESNVLKNAPLIETIDIAGTIASYCRYAHDSLTAKLPKSGKYNVLFTEETLESFFNFFIFHSLGSSFYNNYSLFKLGQPVLEAGTGDKLTIYSDPAIKGGLSSSFSDSFGFPVNNFSLIEDSVLKNIVANNKYSQYLNMPCTGELSNIVVKAGANSFDQLAMADNTLILCRISTFEPKEMTGDFSSEIRVGYLYNQGELIPVKGGSVSGNLRKLMPDALFSSESIIENSYCGPKGIKLFGVDVNGS